MNSIIWDFFCLISKEKKRKYKILGGISFSLTKTTVPGQNILEIYNVLV